MPENQSCGSCSGGCTGRYTEQSRNEEINSAPYLLIAGAIIVGLTVLFQWIF